MSENSGCCAPGDPGIPSQWSRAKYRGGGKSRRRRGGRTKRRRRGGRTKRRRRGGRTKRRRRGGRTKRRRRGGRTRRRRMGGDRDGLPMLHSVVRKVKISAGRLGSAVKQGADKIRSKGRSVFRGGRKTRRRSRGGRRKMRRR